jgi:hypothetical protein
MRGPHGMFVPAELVGGVAMTSAQLTTPPDDDTSTVQAVRFS